MSVFEKSREFGSRTARVGHYGEGRLSPYRNRPTIYDPIEMLEKRFVQQLRENAVNVADPIDWDVMRHQLPECDLLAHERLRQREIDLERAFNDVSSTAHIGLAGINNLRYPLARENFKNCHQPNWDEQRRNLKWTFPASPLALKNLDLGITAPIAEAFAPRTFGSNFSKLISSQPSDPQDSTSARDTYAPLKHNSNATSNVLMSDVGTRLTG